MRHANVDDRLFCGQEKTAGDAVAGVITGLSRATGNIFRSNIDMPIPCCFPYLQFKFA